MVLILDPDVTNVFNNMQVTATVVHDTRFTKKCLSYTNATSASIQSVAMYCDRPCLTIIDVFFNSKLTDFLDTLILQLYFLIIKINNFRGDLSNISAKTATLLTMRHRRELNNIIVSLE